MDDWHGNTSPAGPSTGSSCRSARCSASSPDPPAVGAGQRRPRVVSFAESRPTLGSGGGSRRTSSGTRTRSRWRTKGFRASRGTWPNLGRALSLLRTFWLSSSTNLEPWSTRGTLRRASSSFSARSHQCPGSPRSRHSTPSAPAHRLLRCQDVRSSRQLSLVVVIPPVGV